MRGAPLTLTPAQQLHEIHPLAFAQPRQVALGDEPRPASLHIHRTRATWLLTGLPPCQLLQRLHEFTRNVRNSQPLDLLRTSVACSTPRCDDIDTAWQAVCACACVCVLTALHLRPGIADQWRSPRLRPQVPWPLARRARTNAWSMPMRGAAEVFTA
jgi:hypothetical protein